MDSLIGTTYGVTSTLATTFVVTSPIVSRGLRYDPLRDFLGNLITDFEGNVLFEITATYRSILTEDSFVSTTI